MGSPDPCELRQLHDVDDVYELLDATNKTLNAALSTVAATPRRHGNRLEEVQQSLDLQNGRLDRIEDTTRQHTERLDAVDNRLDRIEDTTRQILDLLRGQDQD